MVAKYIFSITTLNTLLGKLEKSEENFLIAEAGPGLGRVETVAAWLRPVSGATSAVGAP